MLSIAQEKKEILGAFRGPPEKTEREETRFGATTVAQFNDRQIKRI